MSLNLSGFEAINRGDKEVPKYFNFANDVLDKWSKIEKVRFLPKNFRGGGLLIDVHVPISHFFFKQWKRNETTYQIRPDTLSAPNFKQIM